MCNEVVYYLRDFNLLLRWVLLYGIAVFNGGVIYCTVLQCVM